MWRFGVSRFLTNYISQEGPVLYTPGSSSIDGDTWRLVWPRACLSSWGLGGETKWEQSEPTRWRFSTSEILVSDSRQRTDINKNDRQTNLPGISSQKSARIQDPLSNSVKSQKTLKSHKHWQRSIRDFSEWQFYSTWLLLRCSQKHHSHLCTWRMTPIQALSGSLCWFRWFLGFRGGGFDGFSVARAFGLLVVFCSEMFDDVCHMF